LLHFAITAAVLRSLIYSVDKNNAFEACSRSFRRELALLFQITLANQTRSEEFNITRSNATEQHHFLIATAELFDSLELKTKQYKICSVELMIFLRAYLADFFFA
jgi:hypothetical protein